MNGSEFGRRNGSYSTIAIGTWQLLSQNISGNYSTIRLYLYFYYGGGSSVGSSYSSFGIMGTEVKSGSYRYYPGYTLLGTKDITVYHNADGTFPNTSVGFWSYSYHMQPSQETWGTISSGSIAQIPRQANITGANNFNSDANPYMTYNNPGNFKMNFRLEFAGATINRNSQYGTSGGYTFQLTETERNLLLSKCPNSNSLTVRYVVATCLNSSSETHWSYVDRTMTVVNSNPIFSDFEFEDVGTKTTSLTGNPFAIIKGYSEVFIGVSTSKKATAQNYATMSKYRGKIGEATIEIPYNDEFKVGGRIQNASDSNISCSAIDSRNNVTTVTKTATTFIEYVPLTKGNITVSRANGVSEGVTLKIEGTYHYIDFGAVVNSIKSAKYMYKATDSSEWSQLKDIEVSVNTEGEFRSFYFEGLIEGDTSTKGFDIGNSYNFQVIIEDELSSVTFTANLSSGVPHISFAKEGVGIMGKYDEDEGGLLQVGGKDILKKDIMTIYATDRFNVSLTANSSSKLNNLNSNIKTGKRLTYSNSSIVIGKGIEKVLISASISYWQTKGWSQTLLVVQKNGYNIFQIYGKTDTNSNETFFISLPPALFDVKEGDVLTLCMQSGLSQTVNILSDNRGTHLTVEVVE